MKEAWQSQTPLGWLENLKVYFSFCLKYFLILILWCLFSDIISCETSLLVKKHKLRPINWRKIMLLRMGIFIFLHFVLQMLLLGKKDQCKITDSIWPPTKADTKK